MDKRARALKAINTEVLIPRQKMAVWKQRMSEEIQKQRESVGWVCAIACILIGLTGYPNYWGVIIGLIIYRFVAKRWLTDENRDKIFALFPAPFRFNIRIRELNQWHEDDLAKARAIQQQLESRPMGFIFRFADYLEHRSFQLQAISDEDTVVSDQELWQYMSMSYQQRGSAIPLHHYQQIIAALLRCVDVPENNIDRTILIESARLLKEVDDSNALDRLQDTANVMLKEWAFSTKVQPKHEVLLSNIEESEEGLRHLIGWYDASALSLLDRVVDYKNAIRNQEQGISEKRKALEMALSDFKQNDAVSLHPKPQSL